MRSEMYSRCMDRMQLGRLKADIIGSRKASVSTKWWFACCVVQVNKPAACLSGRSSALVSQSVKYLPSDWWCTTEEHIRRKQLQCNGLILPLSETDRYRFEKASHRWKNTQYKHFIFLARQGKGNTQHLIPKKSETISNAVYAPTFCSCLFQASQYIYTSGTKRGFVAGKNSRNWNWQWRICLMMYK